MADTINDVLISIDTPIKLRANEIYALPSAGNQLTWQSATGSDLLASVDRVVFGSLGVSLVNEAKTIWTSAAWVRTTSADTWVIVKTAPISVLSPPSGGGGGGGTGTEVLHPDGTSLLPGIAFLNEPDLGFYRPALNVSAFVNGGISELSINGNTHIVALDNLSAQTRIAIGTLPALTGALRFTNNQGIVSRNAGNTSDINVIHLDTGNIVRVGNQAAQVNLLANVFSDFPITTTKWDIVGLIPAQSGALRLENQAMIMARDPTNTFDIPLIGTNINGDVIIGAPNGDIIIQGDTTIEGNITIEGDVITIGATGLFKDGTAGAPSIAFENEPTLGWYRPGNKIVHFVSNSAVVMSLDGNTFTTGAYDFYTTTARVAASLSLGTNPATIGLLRMPNNQPIYWRNGANSADIALISTNNVNQAVIGHGSYDTYVDGSALNLRSYVTPVIVTNGILAFGAGAAITGALRMRNNQIITARSVGNDFDISIAATDQSNDVILGHYNGVPLFLDSTSTYIRATGITHIQTSPLVMGGAPATTGTIRLPNDARIKFRNISNSADVQGLIFDTANNMVFGDLITAHSYLDGYSVNLRSHSGITFFPDGGAGAAQVRFGPIPANTATINLTSGGSMRYRHSSNTYDLNIIGTDIGNNTTFGDMRNNTTLVQGNVLHLHSTGFIAVGAQPWASTGFIRMAAGQPITSRDRTNTYDINMIHLTTLNNQVVLGGSSNGSDTAIWVNSVLEFHDVVTPSGPIPAPGSSYMFTWTTGGKTSLYFRFGNTGQTYALATEV